MATRLPPPSDKYLAASAGQAFDRTAGVRAAENIDLQDQEFADALAGTATVYASEEEYRNSPYYRKGIRFEEGMTERRAALYARNFDERRERERIIRAGDENGP